MATSPMNGIIQHLGKAMILREGSTLTDGQLLSEYVRHQDETALAVLVRRHSPLVWGVCRRIIGNHHDAEDAFQATFLVLVRKAASIASTELLANWLYGVAYKTALKARATLARRRSREKQVIESAEPAVVEHFLGNDLQPLLDYELSRLPYRYRMVILLCDIDGMTRKDAAQHLHLPEGTVGSSLARAREMLAKRLTQRGVALPAAAMAVAVSQRIALASMRTSFVSLTVRAASQFGAGEVATTGLISLEVAALAAGVLKAMLLNQFKSALAALLLLALVGIGTLAVFASDGIPRVGYQPPEICPAVMSDVIVTRLAEVALDANLWACA